MDLKFVKAKKKEFFRGSSHFLRMLAKLVGLRKLKSHFNYVRMSARRKEKFDLYRSKLKLRSIEILIAWNIVYNVKIRAKKRMVRFIDE
jgi:hypothetical protein